MVKVALHIILLRAIVLGAPTDNYSTINEFSVSLLQNVFASQSDVGTKNFALAPISVWTVFSLLSEGAAGSTFEELSQVLRLPKDIKTTHSLHRNVDNVFKNTNDVILKKQAAIFTEKSLAIHKDFCQTALDFNTEIYTVDTKNLTKLAQDINYFICLATDGRIKSAVKEEFLNNLKMLLVDAIYFKANWTTSFQISETKKQEFYDMQGRNIGTVDMMYQKAKNKLIYADEIEAEILELTYGDHEDYSMLLMLPYFGTSLKTLIDNLTKVPFNILADKIRSTDKEPSLECYVPRFKVESQIDLVQPLKYMGLSSIFDDIKSKLPGISTTPLYASKAIQKVELEVTEEGTVAAAATVVGLENRVLGASIQFNRPFAYMIVDKKSDLVLFAGVFTEPNLD